MEEAVHGPEELVGLEDLLARTAADDHAGLRAALFGTDDVGTIAAAIAELVGRELAPVAGGRFVHHSVGLAVGLRLADGRDVVIKVHRWHAEPERLAAVHRVQAHLAEVGYPAPRPLLAPAAVGRAIATVEEHRAGEPVDGHDPAIGAALATGLAELIRLSAQLDPTPPVGRSSLLPDGHGLWNEPHDLRFDFEATASGAEWIDALAAGAKAALRKLRLPEVVVHLDWRVENAAFADGKLAAVYDWDSLGLAPEAVAAGQASAQYSTDWERGGRETLPTLAEMRAFLDAYQQARGRPFSADEQAAAEAANLVLCAYSARCEHSERVLHPATAVPDDEGWSALLRERAAGPPISGSAPTPPGG